MRWRVILVILCMGCLFFTCGKVKEEANKAPYFSLPDLSGRNVSLTHFEGKKVVLIFWATWCPTCKRELSTLEELFERRELAVVAITLNRSSEAVRSFVSEKGLTFPVLIANHQVLMDYGNIRFLPTLYFIDEKGLIIKRAIGPIPKGEIEGFAQGREGCAYSSPKSPAIPVESIR